MKIQFKWISIFKFLIIIWEWLLGVFILWKQVYGCQSKLGGHWFQSSIKVFLFFCTVILVSLVRIPRYLLHPQPWNRHSKQEENERRGKNLNAMFLFFLFSENQELSQITCQEVFKLLISQNHIICSSLDVCISSSSLDQSQIFPWINQIWEHHKQEK